ncbi:MAG: PVC-type heme-binding CxxCH protein, partial [Pirellulales bacterium]
SLASLRTRPDLAVELVASDPLVASPVAIDFGPDGRVWVAEMYDYPSGTDNNFTPGGRVKFLEDTDGDGRLDRATTFLEDIPFPTGVTVWRGGLLVCAAPDILYAEDTDGDGRADRVQKLYSGFATHNYQGRVNSLEYGLDGWVHGSAGLFGGEIASFRGGDPLLLSQRDFRIRPDAGQIEPAAGAAQQGRVRDDWGNWFGCNSGMLVEHYPLPDHYLRRNPNSVPPAPAVPILRGPVVSGPDPGRLFPIADTVLFKLSGPPGGVTAACGLGIYRDDLLGSQYTGNAFTCEPVNNLVHRRLLVPDGITFKAVRAGDEAASEFLASTDPWFRPVQVRTAPDGALWVVDMYRYVIEHPIWIPPETLRELDVRAGADMGRIYRVVPREGQPRKPLRLDRLDAAQLVAALDSPNAPQRDQAMQQLLWRGDDPAVAGQAAAPLEQLARQSSRPETRLQALCTLDGLGAVG